MKIRKCKRIYIVLLSYILITSLPKCKVKLSTKLLVYNKVEVDVTLMTFALILVTVWINLCLNRRHAFCMQIRKVFGDRGKWKWKKEMPKGKYIDEKHKVLKM